VRAIHEGSLAAVKGTMESEDLGEAPRAGG
jgi:hypothetical protein